MKQAIDAMTTLDLAEVVAGKKLNLYVFVLRVLASANLTIILVCTGFTR